VSTRPDRAAPAGVPRPTLATDRLVLLPWTLAAARALLVGEDPGLPLAEGYPHADTADALRMYVEHGAGDEDGGWFVTLAEDGRVVGDCGTLGWTDEQGRVEIGYGLAAPYRGRGYGTEAVRALADWVAAQPGVTAVSAEVEVGNEPSRRLLARLGFTLAGQSRDSWHLIRARTGRTVGRRSAQDLLDRGEDARPGC
jgi:RimJ/RimL family protein N-acetyltransferase